MSDFPEQASTFQRIFRIAWPIVSFIGGWVLSGLTYRLGIRQGWDMGRRSSAGAEKPAIDFKRLMVPWYDDRF